MELSIDLIFILFMTGIAAGFIDSIAGGGGLLTMPVLLSSGLSPAMALGTNKLQGAIGTLTSSFNYYRHGHIPLRSAMPAMLAAFAGSAIGTWGVQQINSTILATLIPVMLLLTAGYFLISPRLSDNDAHQRLSPLSFALVAASGIGFYDGFFGPGAGSFYVVAYVTLLGYGLTRATAHTKLLNFSSNISALIFFQLAGLVDWRIGLIMAGGQLIGSFTGSHLSIKHGAKLIRPVLIVVSVTISIKLLIDQF